MEGGARCVQTNESEAGQVYLFSSTCLECFDIFFALKQKK